MDPHDEPLPIREVFNVEPIFETTFVCDVCGCRAVAWVTVDYLQNHLCIGCITDDFQEFMERFPEEEPCLTTVRGGSRKTE